jgi:hypothetical protein
VKLCPLPTILTRPPRSRAASTSRTTAAVSAGEVIREGVADSVRAQLRQPGVVPARVGPLWVGLRAVVPPVGGTVVIGSPRAAVLSSKG